MDKDKLHEIWTRWDYFSRVAGDKNFLVSAIENHRFNIRYAVAVLATRTFSKIGEMRRS